jgi:hypothetical protein
LNTKSQIENVVVKGKGFRVTDKDPAKYLPIGVQKSYFMLARSARRVLVLLHRAKSRGGRAALATS